MARKSKINLGDHKQVVNPDILEKIANQQHPMAEMPYYALFDNDKLHEEYIIEDRINEIVTNFTNTTGVQPSEIQPIKCMLLANRNYNLAANLEINLINQLIKLAEKVIRDEYNISSEELILDLEICTNRNISLPTEMDIVKKIPKNFKQSKNNDIIKKRTINALAQGAALKSHYLFHLYRNELNNLAENITVYYQNALIANDLLYFMINDDDFIDSLSYGSNPNNAGYYYLDFDGDTPKLVVKAINFPLVIHEAIKGIITFFSIQGLQGMNQKIIDETDYVSAELWDIRFGPTLWTTLHSLIDECDYDIKKLIFIEIFKLSSDDFVDFMYNVLNQQLDAKAYINEVSKQIRTKIINYNQGWYM